jgi:ribosomal protein S21
MNLKERKHRSPLYGALGVNVLNVFGKSDKGEDLNFALRIFKQDMKDSNILKEYKNRQEYIKPSLKKKRMMDRAKYKESFNIK